MTLSIVIPVHNDAEGLLRLLGQLAALEIFDAIIVCDDASTQECRPAELGIDEAAMGITYLRSDTQRGAGHARNMGLAAVNTEFVLFFDADDLLTEPIVNLWNTLQLEKQSFDFCLFRHIDSRQKSIGLIEPMEADQRLWEECNILNENPQELHPRQVMRISQIAAYPWNKIYRTGFLRDEGILCTEIPVHNDIELHWNSFLKARRILSSGALCAEHFVVEDGNRLTNRRCADRLEVFRALAPLHLTLRETERAPEFLLPLTSFYIRLFDWILNTLETEFHASFYQRAREFLLEQHDQHSMMLISARDPALAYRIVEFIRKATT